MLTEPSSTQATATNVDATTMDPFTFLPPLTPLKDLSLVDPNDTSLPMRDRMSAFVYQLQTTIVEALQELESPFHSFQWDVWSRDNPNEGGGRTCVLQNGNVFEKAGVNISVIQGSLPPQAIQQMKSRGKLNFPDPTSSNSTSSSSLSSSPAASLPFFATGISLVLHPHHPMAPTVHLNYRYFELPSLNVWWFGGGSDLTPSYLVPSDCHHFHRTLKQACDQFDATFYKRFKSWCDTYFYLPHRQETRGIGGLFFDDLDTNETGYSQHVLFQFIQTLGNAFLPSYLPILKSKLPTLMTTPSTLSTSNPSSNSESQMTPITTTVTEREKAWQQLRRGRYVEFNLLYDRGTKFGLYTPKARIESILISLPLTARWEYMNTPEPGSPEYELLEVLKHPREWVE